VYGVAVGGDYGAPFEHPGDVAGAGKLARVWAEGVKHSPEDPVRAEENLDGHRRRYVGGLQQYAEVFQCQD
jgi:hypothetical protein